MLRECRPRRLEVRLSESLDALFLTASPDDAITLLKLIRQELGEAGQGITRVTDGLRVPAAAARSLELLSCGLELIWSAEARRFVDNRERVAATHSEVYAALQQIKTCGASLAAQLIADSDGLDVLDEHQVVNVAAMTIASSPGLCVFDEQGAGKTVTFIFALDLLVERDEADQALIVAPKSMVGEWPKDISRFRGDLFRTSVLTGPVKEKRRLLAEGADVFVTNFETAVAMEGELRSMMRARPGRTVLAVDESFFIKSLDAKRTRALRRLREWAGRAYVLCGTPAPNAPEDLVQQFNLVDFGYCFDGIEVPRDPPAAAPVVQEAIERRGLFVRHLKSEVLPDLPAKRFQRVIVPMGSEQGRLYRANLDDLVADVEAVDEAGFAQERMSFLARRAALLQLCSNPSAVDPGYRETPAKLGALDSLVERVVGRDREKVVIWSFYTASVSAIVDRYAAYGAVRYDGAVNDVVARRDAVRRFQEDDETMIFVANPAAAGAGLTLHRARIAIYESLSNQAAHYLQSLDRIHRRGQTQEVEYLVLLCDGTIEVAEYDRLVGKERAAQDLLGDTVSAAVTRETFLADVREAAALLDPSIR